VLACPAAAAPLEVLGLKEAAMPTLEDVRRRFRHLAMRLHPDKCGLACAEEAFKRVSEAYQLLDHE
jgi:curved DNA-binding protein CbpA